jgi:hypothetical protein
MLNGVMDCDEWQLKNSGDKPDPVNYRGFFIFAAQNKPD